MVQAEPQEAAWQVMFGGGRTMMKAATTRRHAAGTDRTGVGSSIAPTGSPGTPKRWPDAGLFDNQPKKPKASATATKRQEAMKAAIVKKCPKQRPMVSA